MGQFLLKKRNEILQRGFLSRTVYPWGLFLHSPLCGEAEGCAPVPGLPRPALGILPGTSSLWSDRAGLETESRGVFSFIFILIKTGRASTYREVSGMSLQLVLSLMLFVGGGRSEQTTAVGPAGRRQVLTGVFVFRGIGEGWDGRPEQFFIFIYGYCQAEKGNHSNGMSHS